MVDKPLTIITLTRNRDYTERLMDALSESRGAPDWRHVVVNNANCPRITAAVLKQAGLVLEPGYNTTFAVGNNLGAKAALALPNPSGWLLLLNDDVIPDACMLERMWAVRNRAEVIGALLLHKDRTVNHAGTMLGPLVSDHLGRGDPMSAWYSLEAPAVPSVTFAAALIKATLWTDLAGLADVYRYGWEDTDFCLRAIEQGCHIRVARDAMGIHDECGTRPRGGTADRENYTTFVGRWAERIPELLQQYQRRLAPEPVEGILKGGG